MPLELPNLDDRRYADLVAEARRLIPVYDQEWTNHNPSDPGITLLELFAYLTEMLLYRLDRVTAANQRKFLKLLNGPEWQPSDDLTADIRTTVLAVRERERAVTGADFERLATEGFNAWIAGMQRIEQAGGSLDEWWNTTKLDRNDLANTPSSIPAVARALCVPSRHLDRSGAAAHTTRAPGHVSVIVLPDDAAALEPAMALKRAVWSYLDERRTLTTRHHVVGPDYSPIAGEIVIASANGAVAASVRERVLERLASFLDRLGGGTTQSGWPFGRDVYLSELYEQIEGVDGVDYITDFTLSSECLPTDVQCAAATPLWHEEGDLIGMGVLPQHLPLARFAASAIVVAPNTSFVRLQLTLVLTIASAVDVATLKAQAKRQVRQFLHPLHDGPGPTTPTATNLLLAELQTMLEDNAAVSAAVVTVQAESQRLILQAGHIIGVRFEAGELANWKVQVTVESL